MVYQLTCILAMCGVLVPGYHCQKSMRSIFTSKTVQTVWRWCEVKHILMSNVTPDIEKRYAY